jgi:hypothetical protein
MHRPVPAMLAVGAFKLSAPFLALMPKAAIETEIER